MFTWLRIFLVLGVLVGLIPTTAPTASAAANCGYQQTYGPYGGVVGAQTSELVLGITTCRPDNFYSRTETIFGTAVIDTRTRIDWGDGSGFQPAGVRVSDCAVIVFCQIFGAPHTYKAPGTYQVRLKYHAFDGWFTSQPINVYVYDAPQRASVDPANWMGALRDRIGNVKLNELAIPGTHDSGAYGFTAQSLTAPDFPVDLASEFTSWATSAKDAKSACSGDIFKVCSTTLDGFAGIAGQLARLAAPGTSLSSVSPTLAEYVAAQSNAQDRSIRDQLNHGIRYLDLRLCAPARPLTEITLCHGLYSVGMTRVLTDIHDFVVAHPDEVVIVGFNRFSAVKGQDPSALKNALIKQIRYLFSTDPADPCNNPSTCLLVSGSFPPQLTLEQIWQTRGRVILLDGKTMDAAAYDALLYPKNPVFWSSSESLGGEWIQTDDAQEYRDFAFADLDCRCESYNTIHNPSGITTTANQFYGLGTAMSPTDDWVASTLGQRLLQREPGIGPTLGAVIVSSADNRAGRGDLVVDPMTSWGPVLRERAKLSNSLSLNGLYERAMRNPRALRNANLLTVDWYHESRLFDIAIGLNLAHARSAVLFSEVNYGGSSRAFANDVRDLGPVGLDNSASSLRVSSGAVATLFADANYQGACQSFTSDASDLRGSTVGNDTVTSVRLDTRILCGKPWVTLYSNFDFGGASFTALDSTANLNGTTIGNLQASSLIVGPATTVSVYSQPNYTGTCQTFKSGIVSRLIDVRIGNDTIQSVKLSSECPSEIVTGPVTLCANENFGAPCMQVTTDVPSFANTAIGDDSVRSLRVAGGIIAMFADSNYQGICIPFDGGDRPELRSYAMSARASSMLFNNGCPEIPEDRGVTVYDGIRFTGAHASPAGDVADLHALGLNDRISSIAVSPGVVVTLYTDANFTGNCMSFRGNNIDLRSSSIGNDSVSSMRIGTSSPCPGI
jgi:hypothetical protein